MEWKQKLQNILCSTEEKRNEWCGSVPTLFLTVRSLQQYSCTGSSININNFLIKRGFVQIQSQWFYAFDILCLSAFSWFTVLFLARTWTTCNQSGSGVNLIESNFICSMFKMERLEAKPKCCREVPYLMHRKLTSLRYRQQCCFVCSIHICNTHIQYNFYLLFRTNAVRWRSRTNWNRRLTTWTDPWNPKTRKLYKRAEIIMRYR